MDTGLNFEPRNILVFRIGHLGDTLIALPAFWTLKKAFPNARLTFLSNISLESVNYLTPKGVLPAEGLFDDFLSYPTQTSEARSLLGFAKLFFEIRKRKIDAVAYLLFRNRQPSQIQRDLKFFKWAGIKHFFGVNYLLKNHLPDKFEAPLPTLEPESEFLLKCLAEDNVVFDFKGENPAELLLTEAERREGEAWLQENAAADALANDRLIAVAPGSKWESKIWPEEKYAEALSRLITSKNLFPIIFGGPEDFDKGERLLKILGRGANAAGKLGVRPAAAALSHCRLYLGNDTGTMHLAATVGTPCVAIFAAIDYPGRWYPFGENNILFRKTVPCEGCHSRVCKFNHECLETSVDEVYQACLKVLESKII